MKRFFSILLLLMLAAALPVMGQEQMQPQTFMYASRDTCNLYMDIYMPASDSLRASKPTILFVFGGGFVGGKRSGDFDKYWFKELSDEGYAVVSIDYRLGMKGYRLGRGLVGAYKAAGRFVLSQNIGVEDVFSAVSFLASRPDLGVDVGNMVLAGSSAGAIISLAAEREIANGTAVGIPEGFNFKGVMSFAGAVISGSGAPVFKNEPCPILFLHGTADQAVQYNKLAVFGKGIWGSDWISRKLSSKGWDNYCIYRFEGSTHDVAAYMYYLLDIEKAFLEKNVMGGVRRHVDAVVRDESLPRWGSITMDNIYR